MSPRAASRRMTSPMCLMIEAGCLRSARRATAGVAVTSARPIASCCCWPPERSPPRRRSICFRTGNSSKTSAGIRRWRTRQRGEPRSAASASRSSSAAAGEPAVAQHVVDRGPPTRGIRVLQLEPPERRLERATHGVVDLDLVEVGTAGSAEIAASQRIGQPVLAPLLLADDQRAVGLPDEQVSLRHRLQHRDRAAVLESGERVDRLRLGLVGAGVERVDRVRERPGPTGRPGPGRSVVGYLTKPIGSPPYFGVSQLPQTQG